MHSAVDIFHLIETIGYLGMFAVVFAESGLFFGFFLPGDSLLFSAGILAAQGHLSLWILLPLLFVAAVLGDSVGFWTGRKLGGWLLRQKDSFLFKKHHIYMAQAFYAKHGGKAVVIARFLPTVRTFAPIAAGIAEMQYRSFVLFNLLGALLWAVGITLLGFFLGRLIPNLDRYLFPVLGVILIASVFPTALHLYRENSSRESLSSRLRGIVKSIFRR